MRLFLALATQWRLAGMGGGVLGLDYVAAEAVMRIMGMKKRAQVFDQLRTMEAAALRVLNTKE